MPFETSEFVRNGKYTDVHYLASGAHGRVYTARDRLRGLVAVKELAPGTLSPQRFTEFCERFQRESKLQHSLKDNHIIEVIDLEKDSQTKEWYLICELADNKSLKDHIYSQKKLSEKDALSVALDICVALEKMWGVRVVHRDVKPGNILLFADPTRTFPLAKLGDFGSAYEPKQTIIANKPPDIHLTPEYAPPQFDPRSHLYDPATLQDPYYVPDITFDIYSLGITIWEMLTGTDYKDLAKSGQPNLRQYAPNASLGIANVIARAIEDDPSKRYQSPEDLKADLERVRDGKIPTGTHSTQPNRPFNISRSRFFSVAMLVVAGAGIFFFGAFSPSKPLLTPVVTETVAIVAVAPTITNTSLPTLTDTSKPSTATPEPPTATPEPPTATAEPPTATPIPPTATLVPPTETPLPPTVTPTNVTLYVDSNKVVSTEGIEITIVNTRLDNEGLIRVRVSVFNPTARDIDFGLGFGKVYFVDNSGIQYDLAPWFWIRKDANPNNVLPNSIEPGLRREGDLAMESNKLRNDAATLQVVFRFDNERVFSVPVPIPGK